MMAAGVSRQPRPSNGDSGLVDVHLDGAFSEVATRRSEFGVILREGIDVRIAALNRKADLLTCTSAKAF